MLDNTVKNINILYVDDEQQNLDSFYAAFRKHYNIFTATSAKSAIEILRNHEIAVIITDQRMPEMTGIQFLEAIIPEYPNPIRMFMTGYSDADVIINAINKGRIFRYISKPWDENELKQSIDLAIKLYHLERQNHAVINLMHEKSYQLEKTLNLFRKYVPNHIVNEALDSRQGIENIFDGELRIISVLFATIHNIDEFYKNRDPQKIHDYLNNYFALMADCIEEHKGVVDKFIGGSMLAIFGAPISSIENQKNSVFCALSMLEKIEKFNAQHVESIGCAANVGIGINSGEAVVGNIGSQQYITYTAIGDTVNIASRIVELTKDKPNTVLITNSVYRMVSNCIETEHLGQTKIRGKDEPIDLYRVIKKTL